MRPAAPARCADPAPAADAHDLRAGALQALELETPQAKIAAVRRLAVSAGSLDRHRVLQPGGALPGRPPRPRLVPPRELPRRDAASAEGRAALLHSIAHIEFNAINLALDAVWRFDGLPETFYRQWLGVAVEEALHFELLTQHLATLGHAYGDFDAHDGLWSMAEKTAGDLVARLALVPRALEARGLDASPAIRARLAAAGDEAAARILDVILRDEIGHVAIGNRWYRWACARDGLDPLTADRQIADRYGAPPLRPPFNLQARLAAGFEAEELSALAAAATRTPRGRA